MSTAARNQAIAEAFRIARDPWKFPSLCRITRLDGSVGGIEMTLTQRVLMSYFVEHRWTYTVKYRQAMSSIVHIADQLRHVQYQRGAMGMVIGDKEDTYKELMRRQGVMYNSLNNIVQTPLSRPVSSEVIAFNEDHAGLIQGITGGGDDPAIGFSPDYGVVSEYGLYKNPTGFDGAFFAAVNRRPHGVCRLETTPGTYNAPQHEMFKECLVGRGRFQGIFLPWWRDMACVEYSTPMPAGFGPDQYTPEEKDYARKLLLFERAAIANRETWYRFSEEWPIRPEQMWFRRKALETEFHSDPRLFDNKFPPSPHEGWASSSSPTIPMEPVTAMLRSAKKSDYGEETFFDTHTGEKIDIDEWRARNPGVPVLITVDGKGYGKKGDPSAMIAWNMWDWRQAGRWTGDEDPGQLVGTKDQHGRLLRWQRALDADVIIETNKDGVAAAAQAAECPKLHWSGDQPGWFSTGGPGGSKTVALNGLVDHLRTRADDNWILDYETLNQLSSWDGKTRGEGGGKRKHHWDLAICCLIFAYGVQVLGHQRRPKPRAPEDDRLTAGRFLASYADPNPKGRVLGQ